MKPQSNIKRSGSTRERLASAACMAVLLLVISPFAARAQSARLELGPLQKLASKAQSVTDVDLDHQMLQLAQRFMAKDESPDDAEARQLVEGLKGIYIKSFHFAREGEYSRADVDEVLGQLRGSAWRKIVSYRNEKGPEDANIYIMGTGNSIQGLAIISAEPKELTVVNIVGAIDLRKLSDLEGHFGIPKLNVHQRGATAKR